MKFKPKSFNLSIYLFKKILNIEFFSKKHQFKKIFFGMLFENYFKNAKAEKQIE
jgi:hypothetical protein